MLGGHLLPCRGYCPLSLLHVRGSGAETRPCPEVSQASFGACLSQTPSNTWCVAEHPRWVLGCDRVHFLGFGVSKVGGRFEVQLSPCQNTTNTAGSCWTLWPRRAGSPLAAARRLAMVWWLERLRRLSGDIWGADGAFQHWGTALGMHDFLG